MKNAAVDIGIQMSVQVSAFNSPEHIPRSGTAGSCGNSVLNLGGL